MAEIDDVLGDKHEIEFDDLGKLKYMGQVNSSILLSNGATGGGTGGTCSPQFSSRSIFQFIQIREGQVGNGGWEISCKI